MPHPKTRHPQTSRTISSPAEVPETPILTSVPQSPVNQDSIVPSPGKTDPNSIADQNNITSMSEIKEILFKVPLTTGTDLDTLIEFLLEVDQVIPNPSVSPPLIFKGLISKTEGLFNKWWLDHINLELNWPQLKTLIIEEFTTSIDRAILSQRFLNRRQNHNESFPDYAENVLKYLNLLGPSLSESDIIARIWLNQNEMSFNQLQFREIPTSLLALHNLIKQLRSIERQRLTYSVNPSPTTSVSNNNQLIICRYCKQSGHILARCPVRPLPSSVPEPTNVRAIQQ